MNVLQKGLYIMVVYYIIFMNYVFLHYLFLVNRNQISLHIDDLYIF